MKPYFPSGVVGAGTYKHTNITPCLVMVQYCAITKITQRLGLKAEMEYLPLYSFVKGLN